MNNKGAQYRIINATLSINIVNCKLSLVLIYTIKISSVKRTIYINDEDVHTKSASVVVNSGTIISPKLIMHAIYTMMLYTMLIFGHHLSCYILNAWKSCIFKWNDYLNL